jgi:hypothetical protein
MTSSTLRLVCPQWQGAGTASIRGLASEFSFEVARRGCAVGATVLSAVLPSGPGATAVVPVTMGDEGLDAVDGVEAKAVLLKQLGTRTSARRPPPIPAFTPWPCRRSWATGTATCCRCCRPP